MHANSHANMQTKIHACTKTQETDCTKYVQMIKRCLHVYPRSILLGALPIKKPWVCVHPRCTARTIHCPAYKETMGVCAPMMYGVWILRRRTGRVKTVKLPVTISPKFDDFSTTSDIKQTKKFHDFSRPWIKIYFCFFFFFFCVTQLYWGWPLWVRFCVCDCFSIQPLR